MAAKKKTIDFSQEPPASLRDCPFFGYKLDDEQQAFADAIYSKENDIVFCNSPAGTGKNLVAVGTAYIMVQFGMYDEIVYIVSPYAERKQGYLPGDIQTKSAMYYEPLNQALVACGINPNTSINVDGTTGDKTGGFITCATDTFLRGTNLNHCIVIIDECQNYTVDQLKKTLTRIGSDTKVIVIGHTLQCDIDPSKSGFAEYIEHFRGQERCAVCELHTNHRGWISQWADEYVPAKPYAIPYGIYGHGAPPVLPA